RRSLERGGADMYFLSSRASRIRQREAQRARDNRAEIIRALSIGQITRRDLYKWGIFTVAGGLAWKHGLNPFVRSAFAAIPTGTPRSPLFGAQKFTQLMPRLALQEPVTLVRSDFDEAVWPLGTDPEVRRFPAKRLSYHTDFSANRADARFRNPV